VSGISGGLDEGRTFMRGLDIFSGAGGSSVGARAAGIEMVGAIDMCHFATDTYAANFPNAAVVTSKLEDVRLDKLRRRLGGIDVLIASPECTNHSCAKGAAPRNEKSRATAMQVVAYAQAFRPRWLVLENVVHMRPWSRYKALKGKLEALGYNIREQVLNAADYGVPQTRRRLFIVGDRRGEPTLVNAKHRGRKKSVASILDRPGTWSTTNLFEKSRAAATLERANRGFEELGKGSSFLLVYYGTDGGGGWQRLDRPLRTITTVDRFALVSHDQNGPRMRMLQVPELKRAMGFADDFSFPVGTRRDQVRLLGNGVCPPVMAEVLRALTQS
jgi:DNA (cytosine-5)-methyltransferase 1